jgi:hypothetical protein
MLKSFIAALALGAVAISGIVGQAQAQPGYPRPCLKAPKDYIPCPVRPLKPQPSKPDGK